MKYAIITIEKLDGTVEKIKTDSWDLKDDPFKKHGLTAIGYSIFYENGRHMIVHPNSVFRLTIDEFDEKEELPEEKEIEIHCSGLFVMPVHFGEYSKDKLGKYFDIVVVDRIQGLNLKEEGVDLKLVSEFNSSYENKIPGINKYVLVTAYSKEQREKSNQCKT